MIYINVVVGSYIYFMFYKKSRRVVVVVVVIPVLIVDFSSVLVKSSQHIRKKKLTLCNDYSNSLEYTRDLNK